MLFLIISDFCNIPLNLLSIWLVQKSQFPYKILLKCHSLLIWKCVVCATSCSNPPRLTFYVAATKDHFTVLHWKNVVKTNMPLMHSCCVFHVFFQCFLDSCLQSYTCETWTCESKKHTKNAAKVNFKCIFWWFFVVYFYRN